LDDNRPPQQSKERINTMNTLDINTMTAEEVTTLEKQLRDRKNAVKRSAKYSAFEPEYSQYRATQKTVKESKSLLKTQLAALRARGFGKKAVKTTPATTTTKGTKKK